MELPKLNYDDFYKFLMSLGLILVIITGTGIFFLLKGLLSTKLIFILIIALILIFGSGAWLIIWASRKWYKNQKLLDKKLETEVELIEREVSYAIKPKEAIRELVSKSEGKQNIALVSYRITSVLPDSISFNFLKDWRVWFLITNREPKKYKAYIKIKFITNSLEKEVKTDYYGGETAWKLDAFTSIQAPGLVIPEEIKRVAIEGNRIKIQINCEVKDENDKLVERKFPQTYIYKPENNSWFLEP